jgi:hypothetical protein
LEYQTAPNAVRAIVLLTTFRDVPWNAPYYQRLGFHILRDEELGPGLRSIRAHETQLGLPPESRVCMRLALETPATRSLQLS